MDNILKRRWLAHSLFWGGLFLILTLLASLNTGYVKQHFINYLSLLPSQILATYALVYYQVPKLLLRKKYWLFAISFLVAVYVFSLIARLSIVHIAEPLLREDFEQESVMEILSDPYYLFAVYSPAVYVTAFLMLAIKMTLVRFREKHDMEVLRKEKLTNELKFLKSQIHPHFLFNTLNNLYALSLAKSDAAPEMILKLSEMLDYILYQCNVARISVIKEIGLLQNYIALEKLRYGEGMDLQFNHHGAHETDEVAPLLLLVLVENAFKHGTAGFTDKPLIKIELSVASKVLNFKVINSKPQIKKDPGSTEKDKIGLSNLRRQLQLNYPAKHEFVIDETEKHYTASLKINLS